MRRRLADDVGIPRTLDETAAERDAIDPLAERALDDGSLTGNPRRANHDVVEILERAFDGRFECESRLGA